MSERRGRATEGHGAEGRETTPTAVVIVSDFGREAALRFAEAFAGSERGRIVASLPDGSPFMDEHRQTTLLVTGDLLYIKQPLLESYRRRGRALDDEILVGFDGGPTAVDVAPRIGVLVLEALAGSVVRGYDRVEVLVPCNTLAPASRWLEERFAEGEPGLLRVLAEAGAEVRNDLVEVAERLERGVEVGFPTVPAAAMAAVEREGGDALLPLGTAGVPAEYDEEARRLGSPVRSVTVKPRWQRVVLAAITASVSGSAEARHRAEEGLLRVRDEAISAHGPGLVVVEACTDLDYGVGLDSMRAYADEAVARIYGQSPS